MRFTHTTIDNLLNAGFRQALLAFRVPEILNFRDVSPKFGINYAEILDFRENGGETPDVNFLVTAGVQFPNWQIQVKHPGEITLDSVDGTPLPAGTARFTVGQDLDAIIDNDQTATVFRFDRSSLSPEQAYRTEHAVNWMELENRVRLRTTGEIMRVDPDQEVVVRAITWIFLTGTP